MIAIIAALNRRGYSSTTRTTTKLIVRLLQIAAVRTWRWARKTDRKRCRRVYCRGFTGTGGGITQQSRKRPAATRGRTIKSTCFCRKSKRNWILMTIVGGKIKRPAIIIIDRLARGTARRRQSGASAMTIVSRRKLTNRKSCLKNSGRKSNAWGCNSWNWNPRRRCSRTRSYCKTCMLGGPRGGWKLETRQRCNIRAPLWRVRQTYWTGWNCGHWNAGPSGKRLRRGAERRNRKSCGKNKSWRRSAWGNGWSRNVSGCSRPGKTWDWGRSKRADEKRKGKFRGRTFGSRTIYTVNCWWGEDLKRSVRI